MARKKNKVTRGEKLLYTAAIFCLFGIIVSKVFLGASVTYLNMNIANIEYKITNQEKSLKNQKFFKTPKRRWNTSEVHRFTQ